MANQWFKFYGSEYLADPKMASLTPQERSCWLSLLCLASAATVPGKIDFLTVEVLLSKSGIHFDPYNPEEWNNNLGILKKLEHMKMLSLLDDGSVLINNWEKRQEAFLTDAERAKKYRENRKPSRNRHGASDDRHARIEENRIDITSDKSRGVIFPSEDEETTTVPVDDNGDSYERPASKAKYPNARKVFALFPNNDPSWGINTTQLKHGEQLFKRGFDKCKAALEFYGEYSEDEFCPEILTPFDLNTKWLKLQTFRDKQS